MSSAFHIWLSRLLQHGESVQEEAPEVGFAERNEARDALRTAFERHVLDLAGPPIPFDPRAAVEGAIVVANACWRLVGGAPDDAALKPDCEPATAAAHLSADVTLRFLPVVYRRARAQAVEGRLTTELDALLRAWPLSGVLADLAGEPTTPLDFGGHIGLQMLYAERFATTPRTGWLPPPGPSREWVEYIFQERRLSIPVPAPR